MWKFKFLFDEHFFFAIPREKKKCVNRSLNLKWNGNWLSFRSFFLLKNEKIKHRVHLFVYRKWSVLSEYHLITSLTRKKNPHTFVKYCCRFTTAVKCTGRKQMIGTVWYVEHVTQRTKSLIYFSKRQCHNRNKTQVII